MSILKILFKNFQDNSNSNNTKNKQEKLSRIQLLKTHCIAENHKQDNKSSDDNSVLQHDWKAWHVIITTNENMSRQVHWNYSHITAQSDLHYMREEE